MYTENSAEVAMTAVPVQAPSKDIAEPHSRTDVVEVLRGVEVVQADDRKRFSKGERRSSDSTTTGLQHRLHQLRKAAMEVIGEESPLRTVRSPRFRRHPSGRSGRPPAPSPDVALSVEKSRGDATSQASDRKHKQGDGASRSKNSRSTGDDRVSVDGPRTQQQQQQQQLHLREDAASPKEQSHMTVEEEEENVKIERGEDRNDIVGKEKKVISSPLQHQQRKHEQHPLGIPAAEGREHVKVEESTESGGVSTADNFTRVRDADSTTSGESAEHNPYAFFFPSFPSFAASANTAAAKANAEGQRNTRRGSHPLQQLEPDVLRAAPRDRVRSPELNSQPKLAVSMPAVASSGTQHDERPRTQSTTQSARRPSAAAAPLPPPAAPQRVGPPAKHQPHSPHLPLPPSPSPAPRAAAVGMHDVWHSVAEWDLHARAQAAVPVVAESPKMSDAVGKGRRRNRNKIVIQRKDGTQEECDLTAPPPSLPPRQPPNRNTASQSGMGLDVFNNHSTMAVGSRSGFFFPSMGDMPVREMSPPLPPSYGAGIEVQPSTRDMAADFVANSAAWPSTFGAFAVSDKSGGGGDDDREAHDGADYPGERLQPDYGGDLILPGQSVFGGFNAESVMNGMYSFFAPTYSPLTAEPAAVAVSLQHQQNPQPALHPPPPLPHSGQAKEMGTMTSLHITAPLSDSDDENEKGKEHKTGRRRAELELITAPPSPPRAAALPPTNAVSHASADSTSHSSSTTHASRPTTTVPAAAKGQGYRRGFGPAPSDVAATTAVGPRSLTKQSSLFYMSVASFHRSVPNDSGQASDPGEVEGTGGKEEKDALEPRAAKTAAEQQQPLSSGSSSDPSSMIGLDRKSTLNAHRWLVETGRGKVHLEEREPMKENEDDRDESEGTGRRNLLQQGVITSLFALPEKGRQTHNKNQLDDQRQAHRRHLLSAGRDTTGSDTDAESEEKKPIARALGPQHAREVVGARKREDKEHTVDAVVLQRIISQSQRFSESTDDHDDAEDSCSDMEESSCDEQTDTELDEFTRAYPTAPRAHGSPDRHPHSTPLPARSRHGVQRPPFVRPSYAAQQQQFAGLLPVHPVHSPRRQRQHQQQYRRQQQQVRLHPHRQPHRHGYPAVPSPVSGLRIAPMFGAYAQPVWSDNSSFPSHQAAMYMHAVNSSNNHAQQRAMEDCDGGVDKYGSSPTAVDAAFRQTGIQVPVHVLLGFDTAEIVRVRSPDWRLLPDED